MLVRWCLLCFSQDQLDLALQFFGPFGMLLYSTVLKDEDMALGPLLPALEVEEEGGGLMYHWVDVALVDLKEKSGSSSSTSGSDTSLGGGCHRWYSCCCCCLLGQLDREATWCLSIDVDNVLLHNVKAVEDPLVPLSIVSWAVTICILGQLPKSCPHTIKPRLQTSCLYL